jgi:hypothetical protein
MGFLGLKRGVEAATRANSAGDITIGIQCNPLIIKALKMVKN